jgi:hypothetical protein
MAQPREPSSNSGKCHICGVFGQLTYEHVPPKKAFNDGGGLVASLQDYLDAEERGGPEKVRYSKNRKGFGRYSLCQRCNNETGALYGPEYIGWAYQGVRYMGASDALALPYHIFPGRIAKQIITMFASANGAGFFDANPDLRKFVLDRDAVGIPPKFRLYCYRTSQNSERFRTSGIIGMMDLGGKAPRIFSEISFVPFGYILTIDSAPPVSDLLDITFFCHEHYGQYRDLHLPIPSKETHSHFPGDFRNKAEWEDALKSGKEQRAAAGL